ncbi:neo-calmodulin-like isoform X2 [Dreissena polymorpha]|uniref:neo-calmodulin-like isoform X2 n=1 Tax=Dreissena polymorpha TaxID=45954 RepID=UPI002264041B|nr:neo-calmodulin-like isoform X2 [Dreissena polymorpha]
MIVSGGRTIEDSISCIGDTTVSDSYCASFRTMDCVCGSKCAKATNKKTPNQESPKRTIQTDSFGAGIQGSFDTEIRELFRLFDTNNDRSISIQELGTAMRFLGMTPTEQQVTDAMRALDANGNGRIEFQEFYSFMQAEMSKVSDESYTNREDIVRSAFRTFDRDGNGYIDENEFRVAMKKLGETLTDKELDDMMRQADVDGDGKINYEEFVKMWCEAT